MTSFADHTRAQRASTDEPAEDTPPLPFEAEFDGVRRPRAAHDARPCDSNRYWDFFTGTD